MDETTQKILDAINKDNGPGKPRIMSTHFGRKDLLQEGVSGIYSNWTNDFTSACTSTNIFAIDRGAIQSIADAGVCAYGHPIVVCNHY